MKIKLAGLLLLVVSHYSHAGWVEASGKVSSIMTYSTTDTILINLTSDGSPVNGKAVDECSNKTTFAIPRSTTEEARSRMYAMALAAKAAGTTIVLAFDEVGGCEPYGPNPSAYRTIRRMR